MLTEKCNGKWRSFFVAIGVLQIYFACIGANIMDPALHDLQHLYPKITHEQITSLITIPNLTSIPASIFSGLMTGRRLRYRTTLTLSFLLIIGSGAAPIMFTHFSMVILARVFLGFGLGLLFPLGNALIIDLFPAKRRGYMFGVGEVVKNLSLIILQMTVGLLVGISVKISWGAYFLLLISFILLLLFLPEPQIKPLKEQLSIRESIRKIPKKLYFFVVFLCLCMIMQTVYQVNLSSIIITEHLGDAEVAAKVLSTATFTAMFAALSFGIIEKIFKNYTITFCVGFLGVGSLMISLSTSLSMLFVSAITVGVGIGTVSSSFYMKIAECSNSENAALVSAFQVVFGGFGGYLPHYFLKMIHVVFHSQSFRLPITIGSIILFIIAILFGLSYLIQSSRSTSNGQSDR